MLLQHSPAAETNQQLEPYAGMSFDSSAGPGGPQEAGQRSVRRQVLAVRRIGRDGGHVPPLSPRPRAAPALHLPTLPAWYALDWHGNIEPDGCQAAPRSSSSSVVGAKHVCVIFTQWSRVTSLMSDRLSPSSPLLSPESALWCWLTAVMTRYIVPTLVSDPLGRLRQRRRASVPQVQRALVRARLRRGALHAVRRPGERPAVHRQGGPNLPEARRQRLPHRLQ